MHDVIYVWVVRSLPGQIILCLYVNNYPFLSTIFAYLWVDYLYVSAYFFAVLVNFSKISGDFGVKTMIIEDLCIFVWIYSPTDYICFGNRSQPIPTDPNRSQPIPTDPNQYSYLIFVLYFLFYFFFCVFFVKCCDILCDLCDILCEFCLTFPLDWGSILWYFVWFYDNFVWYFLFYFWFCVKFCEILWYFVWFCVIFVIFCVNFVWFYYICVNFTIILCEFIPSVPPGGRVCKKICFQKKKYLKKNIDNLFEDIGISERLFSFKIKNFLFFNFYRI